MRDGIYACRDSHAPYSSGKSLTLEKQPQLAAHDVSRYHLPMTPRPMQKSTDLYARDSPADSILLPNQNGVGHRPSSGDFRPTPTLEGYFDPIARDISI